MKLSLGFSTCPNDTYIFDALIHGKIDTEGLKFEVVMADVEELNRRAFRHEINITKLSYHAFAYLTGEYKLLKAGSALGYKNGPLLISKTDYLPADIAKLKIAIPGKFTTANLLFGIFYPAANQKVELTFSAIEDAILTGEVDAGVIIHENRFTYQKKGLQKISDLGEAWETLTRLPIPLGGIVVDRNLSPEIQQKVDRSIRRSVEFAFSNPGSGAEFIKKHAQELDDDVIKQHIELYVNDFSVNLGKEGRFAVETLYREAEQRNVIPAMPLNYFVD